MSLLGYVRSDLLKYVIIGLIFIEQNKPDGE